MCMCVCVMQQRCANVYKEFQFGYYYILRCRIYIYGIRSERMNKQNNKIDKIIRWPLVFAVHEHLFFLLLLYS